MHPLLQRKTPRLTSLRFPPHLGQYKGRLIQGPPTLGSAATPSMLIRENTTRSPSHPLNIYFSMAKARNSGTIFFGHPIIQSGERHHVVGGTGTQQAMATSRITVTNILTTARRPQQEGTRTRGRRVEQSHDNRQNSAPSRVLSGRLPRYLENVFLGQGNESSVLTTTARCFCVSCNRRASAADISNAGRMDPPK